MLDLLNPVAITNEQVEIAQLPGVPAKLDPPFDANIAAGICDVVAELAEIAVLPTIDFERTLPDRSTWWQPVTDEIGTVIGYDDRTPALVRLRSGNPALPHVLVGGAVGQGKSNLLLVMIHGLAARYDPADLEMYLLDFKHGVEFSALGPAGEREHWLPQVRVLGVHSDRAFGLAVLRHLSDELARRSEIFKSHGNVADIAELAPGPDRPPRILVVLDEFQVLLEDDDELADEAAKLLERLVRLGRAYGVHVVLATQTIEGVKRLATRRDSIFGQVPYRIALKTTPADSQAILRSGNTAAAELQFRGEAVLNANFGSPDDNQHVLVSFADKAVLDELRRELWHRAGPATHPPRIFHLAEPARLTDTAAAVQPELGQPWTGLPIAVTEEPVQVEVRPEPGAGVLVLGDGPPDALGVLSGLALSTAAAAVDPPRFIFMDGTDSSPAVAEGKDALVQTLRQLGCEVETVDKHVDIVPRLFSLRDAVRNGQAGGTYLLGFGFHGVPRMQLHAEGFFESPANALQDIVRDGPAQGLITFGWWNRLHVCTEHLGYGRAQRRDPSVPPASAGRRTRGVRSAGAVGLGTTPGAAVGRTTSGGAGRRTVCRTAVRRGGSRGGVGTAMKTEEQEWSEYARALRTIAGARADAQQAQDRLTAHRSKAEASAMAEADAMAERGRQLELRLNALAEKAAASLQRAGLPAEGKRANHALPEIRVLNDIETVAAGITKQLSDTVEQLEEVRAAARAEQERRKRRTISAALVLVGFVVVWVVSGSFLAGVEAAALAAVTMLAASRALGLPRLPGARWWGWAGAVAVVAAMAAGLPWWLAIAVPVIVSGTAIVLPKKRN